MADKGEHETETVYTGAIEIRYMAKHYTREEMLEGARYFHDVFYGVLVKLERAKGDTYIALLKDEGVDKGILSVRGNVNSFEAQSFKGVLDKIGNFLKTTIGSDVDALRRQQGS